jgi:hypothetical protein
MFCWCGPGETNSTRQPLKGCFGNRNQLWGFMKSSKFVDQRNDAELPKEDIAARTPNMLRLLNAGNFMNGFSGVTVLDLYRLIKSSLCIKKFKNILNSFIHLP